MRKGQLLRSLFSDPLPEGHLWTGTILSVLINQKTREGCGCPKFLAGKFYFPANFDAAGKEKDDDHDQDLLPKGLLHLWSWSSENLLLRRRRTMTMTKIPSRSSQGRLATHIVMVL